MEVVNENRPQNSVAAAAVYLAALRWVNAILLGEGGSEKPVLIFGFPLAQAPPHPAPSPGEPRGPARRPALRSGLAPRNAGWAAGGGARGCGRSWRGRGAGSARGCGQGCGREGARGLCGWRRTSSALPSGGEAVSPQAAVAAARRLRPGGARRGLAGRRRGEPAQDGRGASGDRSPADRSVRGDLLCVRCCGLSLWWESFVGTVCGGGGRPAQRTGLLGSPRRSFPRALQASAPVAGNPD